MIRLDFRSNASARTRAMNLILRALPKDGKPVCYAALGIAGGEDAGPLVQDLIDMGSIRVVANDDMMLYARAV